MIETIIKSALMLVIIIAFIEVILNDRRYSYGIPSSSFYRNDNKYMGQKIILAY